MAYEEKCKIEAVRIGQEDHGIQTVSVALQGEAWGQTFGDLCMKDAAEAKAFAQSLADVFGCPIDALAGQEAVALYAYQYDTVEGLRSVATGRTFTVQAWRAKRGYPAPTPLVARVESIQRNKTHLERQLADIDSQLRRAAANYSPLPEGEAP